MAPALNFVGLILINHPNGPLPILYIKYILQIIYTLQKQSNQMWFSFISIFDWIEQGAMQLPETEFGYSGRRNEPKAKLSSN